MSEAEYPLNSIAPLPWLSEVGSLSPRKNTSSFIISSSSLLLSDQPFHV